MIKKKKIRFLINTLTVGGAEKVLIDLLSKLNPNDYQTELITVSGGVFSKDVPPYVKYKQLIRSNGRIGKLLTKIVYKMPPTLFKLFFMKGKFDIEIAYMQAFPTKILRVYTKKKDVKTYAFIHTDVSVTNFLSQYKSKAQCIKQYNMFTKTCFVSKSAKDGFEKSIGKLENACIIHNVINHERIIERSKEKVDFEYSTKGLKLISVGRLNEAKNYKALIQIASKLEKDFDFELCIVGGGEQRKELERLIQELNVKSVKLLGMHENPYPLLKKADLFVCSSIREGYSTAVVEALTLNLPVITTDCAGMKEILNDGEYGLIVENNEQSLYLGLFNLLQNKSYYDELKIKSNLYKDKIQSNDLGDYKILFKE